MSDVIKVFNLGLINNPSMMTSLVIFCRNRFQIGYFIVEGISIFVVNMVSLWNLSNFKFVFISVVVFWAGLSCISLEVNAIVPSLGVRVPSPGNAAVRDNCC